MKKAIERLEIEREREVTSHIFHDLFLSSSLIYL